MGLAQPNIKNPMKLSKVISSDQEYRTSFLYKLLIFWNGLNGFKLEPSYCKKWQKSPNQETGLGTRERLKVLNDTKLVLNDHE